MTGMRGTINIDVSPALAVVHELKNKMSRQMFEECLAITVRDTGRRAVKKFIKQEIPKEYAVTSGWVESKVLGAKYSGGGGSVSCVVPVKGERGTLGGIFAAGGGGYGKGRAKGSKKMRKLKRKSGGITAQILRGGASKLPGSLPNQGGNPPFRLPNGAVMTRTKNRPYPIARVVGRAVPQMVDKHFEDRIQEPINEYMVKRMEQVVRWKMGL